MSDPSWNEPRPAPEGEPAGGPFPRPTLRDLVAARQQDHGAGQQSLETAPPRLLATKALIAINAAVFVAMVVRGVSPMSPTIDELLGWGANFGPLTLGGEWWRGLSAMFVHIGLLHIALNMWVLNNIGPLVERLLGSVGFLVLYFVSGILASETSVWWNPFVVSAGASGAVFGVIGGLLGLLYGQPGIVPPHVLGRMRSSMLTFVAYNVLFGVMVPGIDMAAHVGGLLAGLAVGFGMGRSDLFAAERRPARNLVAASLGAVAILAATAVLPHDVGRIDERLEAFAAVESEAIDAFNAAVQQFERGTLGELGFAAILENDILPPWIAAQEALTEGAALPEPAASHVARLVRYANARREAWGLRAEALRTGDVTLLERATELDAEVERIMRE